MSGYTWKYINKYHCNRQPGKSQRLLCMC